MYIETKAHRTITKVLDLIFPRYCVGCGMEGTLLCGKCIEKVVHQRNDEGCPLCGGRANFPRLCGPCHSYTGLLRVVALGEFGGALKEALHGLKFSDVREVSKILGDELAKRCIELDLRPGVIIPIPLSGARARERGYNQSALIAKRLAKNLGWPYLEALARVRHTKPQTKLNRAQRVKNLKKAFASKYDFTNNHRPLYILDDVTTTGATLSSAASALKSRGAKNLSALAVAID